MPYPLQGERKNDVVGALEHIYANNPDAVQRKALAEELYKKIFRMCRATYVAKSAETVPPFILH
eukprot:5652609-Amphidinium_carterae.1